MHKRLLSFSILIAFLAGLQYFWGWQTLLQPWRAVAPGSGALLVALLLLSYAVRALRLHDYYRDNPTGSFAAHLKIILYHNFLNNMLPMRSGELSFPVLLARYCSVPPIRSVPALIWFRFLDLHIVLGLGAAAALWSLRPDWYWLLGLAAWLPLPVLAHAWQRRLQARLGEQARGRLGAWLRDGLAGLPGERGAFWRSLGWSALNWVVKIAVLAEALRQFTPLPRPAAWLGAIGGDLSSVLPVHAPGGFGTYEAGVVAGLAPFGVGLEAAVPAALNLHVLLLSASLLGAGAAWLLPGRHRRDAAQADAS